MSGKTAMKFCIAERKAQWQRPSQSSAAPEGELSEDESAILTLLEMTWRVSRAAAGEREDREAMAFQRENLCGALSDAYFMLLLRQSGGEWVHSKPQPWMELQPGTGV